MKKANTTKLIGLILIVLLLLIIMPGMAMTAQAATETIPNGDCTIEGNGVYQLPEGYSGTITIASSVTEVTVTDAIYKAPHTMTSITVAGGRDAALALTIEDIDIVAPIGIAGINLSNLVSNENRLYISGISSVTGGGNDKFTNGMPGIYVPDGVDLIIDEAPNSEGAQLTANGGYNGAGIGGGFLGAGGTITISGGTVTATGGSYGAGIGGSYKGAGGTITISGGTVTATGGSYGAGIGGGFLGAGGTITISGGTVTANGVYCTAAIGGGAGGAGGTITISGGTVTATGGSYGTGIGSGRGETGSTITISGGIVEATGGVEGAGIGGSNNGAGGTITISGGTVTANGGDRAAAIGGSICGAGGTITISGGTVTATGGSYGTGIGSGRGGTGGTITISGGIVEATGGGEGAGIGGSFSGTGGTITISGGIVEATGGVEGAGIGGGAGGAGGTITISGGTVTANGGDSAAGIGGGYGGAGGDVVITGTPIVYATGKIEYGAEHIGMGANGSGSGTIKDGSGVDLSYILFNTTGIAGVKIGLEGIAGEYITNDQGMYGIFVPRSGSVTYTASKAGFEAVQGTQAVSLMNHDISIPIAADNTSTNISSVTPSVINNDTTLTVTFNNDYGIFGTLYLVPKPIGNYTGKAALDGAAGKTTTAINSPAATASVDTTGLAEGTYQFYFVDSAENVSIPSVDIIIDKTAPIVSNGAITISNTTKTGTTLTWSKASDLDTVEAALQYIVYISTADNLNTVADIEANGTVKQDYTADIGTLNIGGLQPSSTYYFNVIVRDNAGNKTNYNRATVTTRAALSDSGDRSSGSKSSGSKSSGSKSSGSESNTNTTERKTNEIIISVSLLAGDAGNTTEIRTELATVILPSNMLTQEAVGNATAAVLTISTADTANLQAEVQAQLSNRPAIELSLKIGGRIITWNNPDAPVTVTVPYKPTAEELTNPENITVWYLDSAGNAIAVPSGRYDPVTGTVSFTTTHLSKYAVVYVKKSFNDLNSHVWAKKQIEVLASKGILKGITETEYVPQTNITRADFLYSLVRTLGVDAKVDGNFDDISSDAYYYKEIGIAKALGITSGIGNNKFSPSGSITRQDMMLLADRALRILKKLKVQQGTAADLDKFTDKSLVAAYAVNSVVSIVKEGLIMGSGGNINPLGTSSRAEAAVFLYKVYNKY